MEADFGRYTRFTMANGDDTSAVPAARPARIKSKRGDEPPIEIRGEGLTIDDVVAVARRGSPVRITDDPEIRRRIEASLQYVVHAAQVADRIYGVTTGFGGMANVVIPPSDAGALQENIARFMAVGAGRPLRTDDVRAAMLLRANSHAARHFGRAAGAHPPLRDLPERGRHAASCASSVRSARAATSSPLAYIAGRDVRRRRALHGRLPRRDRSAALTALERLGLPRMPLLRRKGSR